MRALGPPLLKGQRLTRLVGKASASLRVGKQMIPTVAQHDCQPRKDDLTITRCTELLQLPAATLHLFIVLLDLGTLFIVAHDPRCVQFESGRDQDDMIRPLFLLMPKANHTGMQRHLTLGPHMLYAAHQGNRLGGPGGMRAATCRPSRPVAWPPASPAYWLGAG